MQLRVCSILGILLLALGTARPAFAEGDAEASSETGSAKRSKKKAAKKQQAEASSDADKLASTDKDERIAKPSAAGDERGAKAKNKGKGKKSKAEQAKAEEEAKAAAAAEAASAAAAEPVPEPPAWEAPPQEEEKPPEPLAPPAKKERAGDDKRWNVGLLLGWGFETDRRSTRLAADAYGLGFGARGGYTLDVQFYVGLYVIYYLGSSQTGPSQSQLDSSETTSSSYLHTCMEAGYDWWVGPLIVRPSLLIGAAVGFTDNESAAIQRGSLTDLMIGPGVTVVHPWDGFFLGGEARINLVTGDGVSSLLVAATGGMRF